MKPNTSFYKEALMSNKTRNVDDIYEENAEASPKKGVVRKGQKPPPKGKVTVTHKSTGFALPLLVKYRLVHQTATTVVGLVMIHEYVIDPTLQAHAMWAYGISSAIAMVDAFLRKRE